MTNKSFIFPILIVFTFLTSCYREELQDIENRLDKIENVQIASVLEQVNAIKESIPVLEQADKDLKQYIDQLVKTAGELQASIAETDAKILDARKALEDAVKKAIAEAENGDNELSEYLIAQIEASYSDVLAQLESMRSAMNSQLKRIEDSITELLSRNVELEKEIADLRKYVDDGISSTKDWASVTFATLAHYKEIISQISAIRTEVSVMEQSIAELEAKISKTIQEEIQLALAPIKDEMIASIIAEIRADYEKAINDARSEMVTAYETAISAAISSVETSLKAWVNELLAKDYMTASETIARLEAMEERLSGKMSDQATYLETLIEEMQNSLSSRIDACELQIAGLSDKLGGEINSLSEQVQKNVSDLEECLSQVAKNSEKIVMNAYDIAEIYYRILQMEKDIESLNSKLQEEINKIREEYNADELKEEMQGAIDAAIAAFEDEVDALHTEMWYQITENLARALQNDNLIKENADAIAKNEALIAALESRVSSEFLECAKSIAENTENIASQASLIAENSVAIQHNATAIMKNSEEIGTLKSRVTALYDSITEEYAAAIEDAINENSGKIRDEFASEIAALRVTLEYEIGNIEEQLKKLENRVDSCEEEVASIKKNISNLQSALMGLDDKVASIESQIQSISNSIPELQAMDQKLSDYIEALQESADRLQTAVGEIDADLEDAKEELTKAIQDAIAKAEADGQALTAEMLSNIQATKADIIGQLEVMKQTYDSQLNRINATITELQKKDQELEEQIELLQDYVGQELQDTEDWASATFATLAQYDIVVSDITSIKGLISSLQDAVATLENDISTKVVEEIEKSIEPLKNEMIEQVMENVEQAYLDAIAQNRAEIEDAYNSAISSAITSAEASIKNWVGNQFESYYTIAQVDSKLETLKSEIEDQLNAQKAYLEGVINSLKTDLESKIKDNEDLISVLRSDLTSVSQSVQSNGQKIINNSEQIALNAQKIIETTNQISVNSSSINDVTNQISALESELEDKVRDIESQLGSIGADAESINSEIERIQSDYTGKITVLEASLKELINANDVLSKANKDDIEANSGLISANTEAINALKSSAEEAIAKNAAAIADNAAAIASNASLIAANTGAITNNSAAIAENTTAISDLRTQLVTVKADITSAYTEAINSAITKLDGELRDEIAAQIAAVNSQVASDIEEKIKEATSLLNDRVTQCETEISGIKEIISDLQAAFEDLKDSIADIMSMIQSITFLSEYSDGTVDANFSLDGTQIIPETAEFNYMVRPEAAAVKLMQVGTSAISMQAYYTKTRATFDFVDLPIKSISANGPVLTVTVSLVNISEDFFRGQKSASAYMLVTDGVNDISTQPVTLVPKNGSTSQEATELSANGMTANSYIVPSTGYYSFTPTRGNDTDLIEGIESVEVLWETFGTDEAVSKGDLIKSVALADGYVVFSTADTFREGNALIAAKDVYGNILWSWHLWLTDDTIREQEYPNGAGVFMDRNLGATSCEPNTVGALGLFYQWGRKDPFVASQTTSSYVMAQISSEWPQPVQSTLVTDVDYSVQHPTTFILGNSYTGDWYYDGSNTKTDDTRWDEVKTIYDPCPAGWRVADADDWFSAGFSSSYNSELNGIRLGLGDDYAWYPGNGYISPYQFLIDGTSLYGNVWTVDVNETSGVSIGYSYYSSGNSPSRSSSRRASGQGVRCQKVEVTGSDHVQESKPASNQIFYTSIDDILVTPYNSESDGFGANIISNEYKDGKGVITFDSDITQIGASAFKDETSLLSVEYPETVTSIGYSAFRNCTALEGDLIISDAVKTIGDYAFANCTGYNGVLVIGSNVTKIGDLAFMGKSSTQPLNFSKIYCKALVPPEITSPIAGTTDNSWYGQTTWYGGTFSYNFPEYLGVPVGTGSSYSEASGWRSFKTIEEVQF